MTERERILRINHCGADGPAAVLAAEHCAICFLLQRLNEERAEIVRLRALCTRAQP